MSVFLRLAPATFVLLWATGFIGARYAMPWAEPFTFLSLRFVLAFLLLSGLAVALRQKRVTRRGAANAMVAGALMHGVYLGGVFWAIRNGMPAGLSALIVGLQPLITAVLAGPALGERILPRHWIGLVTGFAGVLIVVLPTIGSIGGRINAATLGASFVAVLGMACGTIWQKRSGGGGALVAGTAWQYAGGALVAGVASALFETQRIVWNGELVFALAWLLLVLSVGAIFLLMYLIREGEIAKVASLFYLVPAVTALMAWALFGETLTLLQLAGMAVAALGVALSTAQVPTRARASR